jgi:NTE family protein
MALPGLFPAIRHEQRWLVDGGLVNPVPVSVCRALGADIVIAVNLNSGIVGKANSEAPQAAPVEEDRGLISSLKQQAKEYSNSIFANHDEKDEAPGLFYAIANSVNIFQDRVTRSRLAGDPADVVISPQVAGIGMLEFHRAAEAIKEGEDCLQSAMDEIRSLMGKR